MQLSFVRQGLCFLVVPTYFPNFFEDLLNEVLRMHSLSQYLPRDIFQRFFFIEFLKMHILSQEKTSFKDVSTIWPQLRTGNFTS